MISIVIPTLNEEENIEKLVPYLQSCCSNRVIEIIVADCGSQDRTRELAASFGAKVITSSCKGRSVQMNAGAASAKYDILYFVHADSVPPKQFCDDIINAVSAGYEFGRYQTKFEGNKWLLKINAFFTRFDWFMCYGGDQTLFVTTSLFKRIGGYKNELIIMEEYEFAQRAKAFARYKIFNDVTLVSIRKYQANSWLRVQRANYTMIRLFKKGIDQNEMIKTYKQLLTDIK